MPDQVILTVASSHIPHVGTIGVFSWGAGLSTTYDAIDGISITPTHAGPVERITDGNGKKIALYMLTDGDGFEAKIDILYHKEKAYPAVGDWAKIAYGSSTGAKTFDVVVTGPALPTFKKGAAATVQLTVEYSPGITKPVS